MLDQVSPTVDEVCGTDPSFICQELLARTGSRRWAELGDIVFLRVCKERCAGMVTGICLRPRGSVIYYVSWESSGESGHYDMELCSEFIPAFE